MTRVALAALEVSAGLTGRVTDATGASIHGASVNARDLSIRGSERNTVTNESARRSLGMECPKHGLPATDER